MRIFVESPRDFNKSGKNTGIPRVTRNITRNLSQIEGVECIPIIFRRSVYYDARRITSRKEPEKWINKSFARLFGSVEKLWRWYDRLCVRSIKNSPLLQKVLLVAFVIGGQPLIIAFKIVRALRIKKTFQQLPPIDVQAGDVILWPGSLDNKDAAKRLSTFKSQGACIIVVMHDLFLITQPEFMRDGKDILHKPPLLFVADGFIAISATVRDELREYLKNDLQFPDEQQPWIDYFYLGSELDLVPSRTQIRPVFKKHFDNNKSSYLMVGTLQPRKNYAYALDAFERLWADNVDVDLCIVGIIGWKCEELVKRIRNHPEWNRHLFMWNDTNDTELEYCYRHSKALVYSSIDEGFGLPLVEAMQHGLPVMASDIPIFRELGGKFVAYFDLSNPQMLCDYILEFEQSNVFPAVQPVSEWKWLTWKESAQQLIERIMQQEMSR